MELETEGLLVQKCRALIEERLKWGEGEQWSTQDFEALSDRIFEKTQVRLSVVTLKRIWGKIRYDSRPTITTLNTLAQFIDFENWRTFRQQQALSMAVNGHSHTAADAVTPVDMAPAKARVRWLRLTWPVGLVVAALALAWWLYSMRADQPLPKNHDQFTFTSKKIVAVGVPNTVIFNYDATAALPSDSIFIQQTWDPRFSQQVARDQQQHTAIYYRPGFFHAKLRVNKEVVKEHSLFIQTDGWLPLVDLEPVPVYFPAEAARHQGKLGLTREQIEAQHIALQPTPPWVSYYNVGPLAQVYTNDFVFESEVKNTFNEGAGACQHSEVHLLFQGGALIVPLSIPGCVSELQFLDRDGKKSDLSAFGVDFSDWVKVRAEVKDSLGMVKVNDRVAGEFKVKMNPLPLAGLVFRFRGTGEVKNVHIRKQDGTLLYEEFFKARTFR